MGMRWHVKDERQAKLFCQHIMEEAEARRERLYTIVHANRSNKQNAVLHLLFRRLAEGLNDAGFEITHPFKADLEIPYTEHSVKELLYRPIIEAMFGESSSTQLSTNQFSEAMTTLVDAVCRNTGVNVPIPTEESLDGPY